MLVLSRKIGQRIMVGPDIVLTIVEMNQGHVRLGFEAPSSVGIYREEVWVSMQQRKEEDIKDG